MTPSQQEIAPQQDEKKSPIPSKILECIEEEQLVEKDIKKDIKLSDYAVDQNVNPPSLSYTEKSSEKEKLAACSCWRKPLIDQITVTEVTVGAVTVTIKECFTDKGFFTKSYS